jgi:hypothetical protein
VTVVTDQGGHAQQTSRRAKNSQFLVTVDRRPSQEPAISQKQLFANRQVERCELRSDAIRLCAVLSSTAICHEVNRVDATLWGKRRGKNQLREKTISHKKIQSPLSDWIS